MINSEDFLEKNKGLIESLANKFYLDTPKFSKDDLLQEASLAAIKAIDKFDETKNKSKLSTYVYSAVHRSCRDFVRKNKHDLYQTGYHQTQDWKKSKEAKGESESLTLGGFPPDGPMAIRMDVNNPKTGETFAALIPSGDPTPAEFAISKEQIDILKQEIQALPERERDIINARYFDDKKLADIAREQGVTRQRINQISQRAFTKLKTSVQKKLGLEIFI